MATGNLYKEPTPESVTNRPRDMRIDPATVAQLRPRRESKAWFAWLFLGMMFGGAIMGTWDIYQERLESDREMRAAGYRHFPDLNLWYSGNETDQQVRARYRTPAASQSGGHLSQPTAGAR